MFTKISIEDLDSIYSGDENTINKLIDHVYNINYANKNKQLRAIPKIAEDCRNVCVDNSNVLKNWVAEEYGMTKVLTEEQIDTIFDWSDNQCNNTSERFNMVREAFDLIKRMKFIK